MDYERQNFSISQAAYSTSSPRIVTISPVRNATRPRWVGYLVLVLFVGALSAFVPWIVRDVRRYRRTRKLMKIWMDVHTAK